MRALGEWIKKHQKLTLFSEIITFLIMVATMELAAVFLPVKLNLKEIYLWFLVYACVNLLVKDLKWKKIFVTVVFALAVVLYFALRSYGMGVEVLIGIMGYNIAKMVEKQDFIRKVYVFLLTSTLIFEFVFDKELTKNVIAVVFVLTMREIVSLWEKENSLRIFPVLLMMEIMVMLLPVSKKPFDWSFVMKAGEAVVESCRKIALEAEYLLMDKVEFGKMQSTYTGDGKLRGSLMDNDKEELYISAKATVRNLYLAGTEFEELDGKEWKRHTSELPYGLWYAKYLNTLYQENITKKEARVFSENCLTKITYGYLKTDTMFHTLYGLKIKKDITNEMTDNLNEYRFQRVQKKNCEYPIVFLDFDYSNEYLSKILYNCEQYENGNWLDYDSLDEYSYSLYNYPLHEMVSKAEYEDFVKKGGKLVDDSDYVTNNTSDRVKQLAKEITEGQNSDYAKAVAIETFLRKNYTYSKNVDNSKAEDVMDTFLFETKKGYCMHYASAMTLLLQLNGIPARFVEGYLCDYTNKGEERYIVTGNNSHAWTEAYIKGFGWVRFEPTASYSNAEQSGWNFGVSNKKTTPTTQVTVPTPVKPQKTVEEKELPKENSAWSEKEIVGSVILFIIVFSGVLFSIFLIRRRVVYKRKTELGKIEMQIRDMEWMIQYIYPGEWENRPLLDYAVVITDKNLKNKIERICYLYYQAKYKKKEINEADWNELLDGRKVLYRKYIELEKKGKCQRKWTAFWKLEAAAQSDRKNVPNE